MNKSLSVLVYVGLWLLLVLAQTFLTSGVGDTPSVFVAPEMYYSIWVVDFYLIILFYTNYYLIAPKLIRRRLFGPYIGVIGATALLGFLIPIILYVGWQWTMPGTPVGAMPLSLLGVIGAIVAMSLGLAVRSVLEWIRLEECQDLERAKVQSLELEVIEQKQRIANLESELSLAKQAEQNLPQRMSSADYTNPSNSEV